MRVATTITMRTERAEGHPSWRTIRWVATITVIAMCVFWLMLVGNELLDEQLGGVLGVDLRLSKSGFLALSIAPVLVLFACLPYAVALHWSRQRLAFWPGLLVTSIAAAGLTAICGWVVLVASISLDDGWRHLRAAAFVGSIILSVLVMQFEILVGVLPVVVGYVGLRAIGSYVLNSVVLRMLYGLGLGALSSLLFVIIAGSEHTMVFSWPEAALAGMVLLMTFRRRWAGLL